jgi:hypothetical protein
VPTHKTLKAREVAHISFGEINISRVRDRLSDGDTAVASPIDDGSSKHLDQEANLADTSTASALLETCQPITHAEITEKLKDNGKVRSVILEAQDDSKQPKYAVFLLTNWRKGYCVLHVYWPARARLFRDLDRLLVLLRFEYAFTGTIALKRASDVSEGKRHWRVTL